MAGISLGQKSILGHFDITQFVMVSKVNLRCRASNSKRLFPTPPKWIIGHVWMENWPV